ncbi:unnamed protein product [Rotaria socialis]|uniref:Uncharacterized protein n=1 Tax=Rotaria socialis TaxID=392032 RepID=A0A820HPA3_9BILA|nr:unnamed protein product [Rotaria socialis]CAF3411018.1 unnamed protein product [Rotaria socialis]CAF4296655.1 unnamed protein product [Rotaria socialis]CAF4494229.1 unnamed protein product [Rotaria socialis]
MDHPSVNRNALTTMTNQPIRETSKQNDLLVKLRALRPNKPNLVQHLTRSNPIQISSGLKILQTRIQSNDDPSYQPLVTISDNEHSDEDDFVSPIHKLTKNELREELKLFRQNDASTGPNTNNALLTNNNDDDDADDIEFRTYPSTKRSVCCSQFPFSVKERFCTIS